MPLPADIEQPVREANRVALYPVRNAIASMMLVAKDEQMPGTGAWVTEMRSKLTADESFKHRLVIIGFFHAILPENDFSSFEDYLVDLEHSDPVALRDKMLNTYALVCINCSEEVRTAVPDWEKVLASPENYVSFLVDHFGADLVEKELELKKQIVDVYYLVLLGLSQQVELVLNLVSLLIEKNIFQMIEDCIIPLLVMG